MAWSAAFINELHRSRYEPRFILETATGTEFLPGTQSLALSSHYLPGYVQGLGRTGNRISASSLSVGDWTTTVSEMTIGYRGRIEIRRAVTRGQLLVLRVGWPGWAAGDYEPVFNGHVSAIARSGDDWSITMRSVVGSLASRMTQDVDESALFGGVTEGEIASAYVAGAASVIVTSVTGAETDQSGNYLLQLFPDDGSDPFFLTATGTTPPFTFTGVSATAILGTTAAGASGRIIYCAYSKHDPVDVARRVLVSTGGTNGLYDTLPFSWGVGIPDYVLDHDDIERSKDLVGDIGIATPTWDIYSTEAQDDGLSWLQGVLSPAGVFLCERQGQLTIRVVGPADEQRYTQTVINDADIIAIGRHDAWDTGNPVEFAYLAITEPSSAVLTGGEYSPTTTFGETLETRPASGARTVHLPYVHDDAQEWCDAIADRLGPWSTRPAELVEFTCRGLRLAMLAPSDTLQIDSRHFLTRDRATFPELMVLSVETDWWGGTVRLIAAYHPPTATEF